MVLRLANLFFIQVSFVFAGIEVCTSWETCCPRWPIVPLFNGTIGHRGQHVSHNFYFSLSASFSFQFPCMYSSWKHHTGWRSNNEQLTKWIHLFLWCVNGEASWVASTFSSSNTVLCSVAASYFFLTLPLNGWVQSTRTNWLKLHCSTSTAGISPKSLFYQLRDTKYLK